MTGSAVLLSKCGVGLDRGAMTTRKRKAVNLYADVKERDFQATVLQWAKVHGWAEHHTWSSVHSPAGWPDLVLCRPPRLIFAELKKEDGQMSSAQTRWLNTLRECPGVETYLWRPRDIDAVIKVLEAGG